MSQTEPSDPIRRKLTTILAADAAQYSAHMRRDETGTYAALHKARGVFQRMINHHGGRIANTAGDGLIAEFPSVVESVSCAMDVQRELGEMAPSAGERLDFRIGVHLGDVMVDGDDLLGDGVNLAARLQEMAEPGGILISRQVYDQVRSKLSVSFESLGGHRPKNFVEDVEVFRIATGAADAPRPDARPTVGVAGPEALRPDPEGGRTFGPGPEGRAKFIRCAQLTGIGLVALALMDVVTGGGLFVHWVIVAALMTLGITGAGVYAPDPTWARRMRYAAISAGVVAINLFTWSGGFWAIYPLIGMGVAEALATLRPARD
ncbi:adenylate/guanylate cyclase domain-containing protein [Chachezhania antarctica]|uniref:adenylate/guanylate cyclase domain-containing protein n=1 Tax=Chachezhania antarctica TaxID=2340860 RepID=UPI000EB3ECC2|nr:adenylate/guanylate cyclase domain-containing protein [Chachezhania antarctica]